MPTSYSKLQILLHWIVVVLLIPLLAIEDPVGRNWPQLASSGQLDAASLPGLHVYVGTLVLILVAIRLILRLVRGAPQPPKEESERLRLVAKATHWALYGVLILSPVFGLTAWYGGVYGLGDVHGALSNLLIFLIGLHIVGALYHQFILGTNIMARMKLGG